MQTYGSAFGEDTDFLSLIRTDVWKSYIHVTDHDGNEGNERSHELVKQGIGLRFKLMNLQSPDWFRTALTLY